MVGVPNAPINGVPALGTISGAAAVYPPHWGIIDNSNTAFSTTAGRLYFIPYYFPEIVSYTGLKMRNTGTGDNTETLRMGVYQKDFSTNKPGALVADCGQITLTGAAATNTLASAFTPAYVGWHYLAYHANTAAQVQGIYSQFDNSAVGVVCFSPANYMFGISDLNINVEKPKFGGYYVDTTYGALASTAVSPTGIVDRAPVPAPYRT